MRVGDIDQKRIGEVLGRPRHDLGGGAPGRLEVVQGAVLVFLYGDLGPMLGTLHVTHCADRLRGVSGAYSAVNVISGQRIPLLPTAWQLFIC